MDTVVGHAAVPVGFTNSFALGSSGGSSELSTLERGTLRALLSRSLGDSNSISLRAGANVRVGPFTTSALARYKMTIQQYDGAGQLERLLNPDGTELYLNSAGNGWDVLQDGLYLRPLTEQDLEAGDAAQANGGATFAWDLGVLSGLLNELSGTQGEYAALGGGRR